MASTSEIIEDNSSNNFSKQDVMNDIRYICKSCSLITDSLQKGSDVMQMPNGDILVTEVKTLTFHYSWDSKKNKLVRQKSGTRHKKDKQTFDHQEEIEEFID